MFLAALLELDDKLLEGALHLFLGALSLCQGCLCLDHCASLRSHGLLLLLVAVASCLSSAALLRLSISSLLFSFVVVFLCLHLTVDLFEDLYVLDILVV